ncbi:HEAT repeat domain-containing protein [Chloroflexota bacterium]
MSSPFEETIAKLANSDEPLRSSRLINLSNLNPEEIKLFEQAWAGIKPELRREIIYRLVELAKDNVALNFDSIFRYCLEDTDAEVRSKAIEGLWESEDTSLINPLVELLEQDSSQGVQTSAATALGQFALSAEFGKLRSNYISRVEHSLLAAIGDNTKSIEVRCRALEAVAPLGRPSVSKVIQEVYESDDTELKISAVNAMGKNYDPSWLPILLSEITSPNAEMRYEAAEACGELGEEEAVPYLIQLVNDPDAGIALAAIQALGSIGGNEAKRFLEQCLDDPEELVQQAAAQALDELEAEEGPFSSRV